MPLKQEELEAFGKYIYQISAAKGSGEHALRYILTPMGGSHSPLEDRLQHLKVSCCMHGGHFTPGPGTYPAANGALPEPCEELTETT